MTNPKFSDEFKINAVKLANNRENRSLVDVAKEAIKWIENIINSELGE